MPRPTLFRLNRALHQLALGTWFGALAAFVIAAINIFTTVPLYHPTIHLAPFDNPAFAAHTTDILAGGIVIHILWMLACLQGICAFLLVLTTILDATLFADYLRRGRRSIPHLARLVLVAAIVVIFAVNHAWIMPRMGSLRGTMYNPQQPPAARAQARDRFDQLHAASEKITTGQAGMLLITLFLGPFVSQAPLDNRSKDITADG